MQCVGDFCQVAADDGLVALGIASPGEVMPPQGSEGPMPHAHLVVPYKSLLMARLEQQLPAMRGEQQLQRLLA